MKLPHSGRSARFAPALLVLGAALQSSQGALAQRTWRSLGRPVTTEPATDPRLHVDRFDRVWIAFEDCTVAGGCGQLTVMRYDAAQDAWVLVGPRYGASEDRSFFNSLTTDLNGAPFVASLDYGAETVSYDQRGLNVRGFEASAQQWLTLGGPALSMGQAHCPDLALTPSGDPIVAFDDGILRIENGVRRQQEHFGRNSVMKFERNAQGAWTSRYLGAPGFSGGRETWHNNVEVDRSGTVWSVWRDETYGRRAVAARYDALRDLWEPVGAPGFTIGDARNLHLRLDHNDRPHVIYFTGAQFVFSRLELGPTLLTSVWAPAFPSVGFGDLPGMQYRDWAQMEFDPFDQPLIAYRANGAAYGGRIVVRRFHAASQTWPELLSVLPNGEAQGASAGEADSVSLAIGPSGRVFVAYRDLAAAQGGVPPVVVKEYR
ncbi:MAG: hypothetical protein R3F49_09955 [Planctomycetota bacterium]